VEAGKKAAAKVLELQIKIEQYLKTNREPSTVEAICRALGDERSQETAFKVLRHLAANGRVRVQNGATLFDDLYLMA
jgi:glucose-6-phosphate isomerase